MTSLLSGSDVAQINQLRRDGWDTSIATSNPKVNLVLFRPNATSTPDELVAQTVRVTYPKRATRSQGGGAMRETQSDVIFSRPIEMLFDVAIGDRFVTADETGSIIRVSRSGGMIRAEGTLEGGIA